MSYYMEVSSCPNLPLSWVPNCPVPNCPVSKCPVPSCPVSSCPGFSFLKFVLQMLQKKICSHMSTGTKTQRGHAFFFNNKKKNCFFIT